MQILTFREKEPSQSPSPTFAFCLPLASSLCITDTRSRSSPLMLSLSPFLFCWWQAGDQMRKTEDLLTQASVSFFISYHLSDDLPLIHSLALKHVHTSPHLPIGKYGCQTSKATDVLCLKLVWKNPWHIKVYSYVWRNTNAAWLDDPAVSVCCPPHMHINKSTKDRPYLGELCAERRDANRCSFKRAENYVSNTSGACLKEFMFCIWNGVVRLCIHWIIYQASQTEGLHLY